MSDSTKVGTVRTVTSELRTQVEAELSTNVGTRLVGENQWAKFWEIVLPPGARCGFHAHHYNYYWVIHQGARIKVGYTDGTHIDWDHETGEVTFVRVGTPPAVHDIQNIGDTTLIASTVELLGNDELFWKPE